MAVNRENLHQYYEKMVLVPPGYHSGIQGWFPPQGNFMKFQFPPKNLPTQPNKNLIPPPHRWHKQLRNVKKLLALKCPKI